MTEPIKWEILIQDCNGQGHEFLRGTGIYIEAPHVEEALAKARTLCCAADPQFIRVRSDDTEPRKSAECTPAMIRYLFAKESAAKSSDWLRQDIPTPLNIRLTCCSLKRGVIRRPGPGLTETIEPDLANETCSFVFEIEEGDIKLQKTVTMPTNAGGEKLIQAIASLIALHDHAIGKKK